MKYLLDTNILSEPVKTDPDPSVLRMLHRHENDIATAAPVWHELQYGCRRLAVSKKRERIELFLEQVVKKTMIILPYDGRAAKFHAEERARLVSMGRPPPFVDGQIAAVAGVNDLVLVTRNIKDYQMFSGLKTENWFESE